MPAGTTGTLLTIGAPAIAVQVIAQAIPDVGIGSLLNAGATAVLGVLAFWAVCKTIPAIVTEHRKAIKDLTDRQDAWEKIRHDDHEHLQDALRNCAKVQALTLDIKGP